MKKILLSTLVFGFIAFACLTSQVLSKESCNLPRANVVKASHILVDTKDEAVELKNRIDKGESFEMLAQKYSKCPSGRSGGDLGYFKRGQMVKSFEDVAFSLPVNEVSNPVETEFGWHLIKVYDRK